MHSTIPLLTHFIQNHEILAYAGLFLGIILEGEIFMIFAGILAGLGAFDIQVTVLVSFAGALVKSLVWYALGKAMFYKYPTSALFKFLDKKVRFFLPKFKERPFWSIFISKFIYGLNHFTLLYSGYVKVDFKTYFKAETYSSVPWVIGFLSLGYFFSYAALSISKDIRKFSIVILLFFIGFILLENFLAFLYELRVQYKKLE